MILFLVSALSWLLVLVISILLVKSWGRRRLLLQKCLAWDTSRMAKIRSKNEFNIRMTRELFSNMAETIKRLGGPVLEIGAGSGPNLGYYPNNTRLITVDLNEYFKPYLEKNIELHQHVKLEQYLIGNAEDMKELVADNSCSCVVSSLLLCCVDQEKVLSEVMRVLKPGGCFYFVEHIVEKPGTWTRWVQEKIEPTWASLRANCHVARNTDEVIKNFGFDNLTASVFYRQLPKFYCFAQRSYVGHASKPIKN